MTTSSTSINFDIFNWSTFARMRTVFTMILCQIEPHPLRLLVDVSTLHFKKFSFIPAKLNTSPYVTPTFTAIMIIVKPPIPFYGSTASKSWKLFFFSKFFLKSTHQKQIQKFIEATIFWMQVTTSIRSVLVPWALQAGHVISVGSFRKWPIFFGTDCISPGNVTGSSVPLFIDASIIFNQSESESFYE